MTAYEREATDGTSTYLQNKYYQQPEYAAPYRSTTLPQYYEASLGYIISMYIDPYYHDTVPIHISYAATISRGSFPKAKRMGREVGTHFHPVPRLGTLIVRGSTNTYVFMA
jgi:hypothetical protein